MVMLEDKDRIFTNVYGFQPWNLTAAKQRGDWDNTKKLMELGQDGIIEEVKASGLSGRGGAGFATGLNWSFMPKERKEARMSVGKRTSVSGGIGLVSGETMKKKN